MISFIQNNLTEISFTIALAIACGFRVGLTLLLLIYISCSDALKSQINLDIVLHPVIIAVAILFFLTEFIFDNIAGFDCALDSFLTYVKLPFSALLSFNLPPNYLYDEILMVVFSVAITTISHFAKAGYRIILNCSRNVPSVVFLSVVENVVLTFLVIFSLINSKISLVISVVIIFSCLVFLFFNGRGIFNIAKIVFGIFTGFRRKISY